MIARFRCNRDNVKSLAFALILLLAIKTLAYIRSARAPLLVLQGDNDIRVPKEEAEQVVRILRDAGKTVDVHYYPTEGHGFVKRENQIDAIQRIIAWFDRYLKVKN